MSTRADRLRNRISIDPDELSQPTPIRPPAPAAAAAAQVEASQRHPAPETKEPAEDGAAYFRSFYLDNDIFARFRAAVFWSSRNPQAAGQQVPENMSVAVEEAIHTIATDLETRFNDGEPFPEPPATRKRRRRKGSALGH